MHFLYITQHIYFRIVMLLLCITENLMILL